ncbi:DNA-directed RNA polymerase subunit beta' [Lacticaseibacillus rhamnosus MTCC 5462]|nr:DNA-directed RNA polymerase subunit beta' [Lacticaseibacillus rhamnosus MTCC 5462]
MATYRHEEPKSVGTVSDSVYSISDIEKQMKEKDNQQSDTDKQ